jgi:hypothetical protein
LREESLDPGLVDEVERSGECSEEEEVEEDAVNELAFEAGHDQNGVYI